MKQLSLFHKTARLALLILPVFLFTQCFQIAHILDWKDDGSMNVRWVFRFSKSLDQAQQGQQGGEKKGESLKDMMEKEKKELPDSLKNLVKNLAFKKIDNEYDSGMEISFLVPDYAKFPFGKIKKEDFPMIPQYLPDKKQVIFHFEPMKKQDAEKKNKKASGGKAKGTGDSAVTGDESLDQMGKQLTGLFLSSVRYQIFLGKKFNTDRAVIRKGKDEKTIELQQICDITLIDLPLFSMFGEKEEPFDMVIFLK
ncbi:MAG: hypothetical protein JW807_01955 [Spirochaetes bacterium]|nr:hypothetical protein [Spirochaetota bacterium]